MSPKKSGGRGFQDWFFQQLCCILMTQMFPLFLLCLPRHKGKAPFPSAPHLSRDVAVVSETRQTQSSTKLEKAISS